MFSLFSNMGDVCSCDIQEVPQFSDWMSQLPAKLHSVPLNSIAIPGSHDSTAFYLNENAPLGPDVDKALQEVCKIFSEARKIVHNWSITQSLNYEQQLEAGVRYFDVRVSTMNGTEDLYLVHGMYSYKVEEMVSSINQYLQDHPREVVFLDFNHFYGMTPSHHEYLLNMIKDVFGSKICPYLDMDSVNLNTLWENKLQVLVFYQDKAAEDNFLFWPGSKIPSPWPNMANPDSLVNVLEKSYERGRDDNTFYVTQGVLTPDKSVVIEHLTSGLKNTLSIPCNKSFVKWLKGKKSGEKGINICIADFVELSDYIPTLMQLNKDLAREL